MKEATAEVYMFTKVVEKDLTYGQAMDKAIHEGKKVTRAIWKGYWELGSVERITVPVLLATLRDSKGVVTATAYIEDKLATDWMVVE